MIPLQPAQTDADYALSLLNSDASAADAQKRLIERGLDREYAKDLLNQAVYEHAAGLLNSGVSQKGVKQQLVSKGLSAKAAKAIIDDVLAAGAGEGRTSRAEPIVAQALDNALERRADASAGQPTGPAEEVEQVAARGGIARVVSGLIVVCGYACLWTLCYPFLAPFLLFMFVSAWNNPDGEAAGTFRLAYRVIPFLGLAVTIIGAGSCLALAMPGIVAYCALPDEVSLFVFLVLFGIATACLVMFGRPSHVSRRTAWIVTGLVLYLTVAAPMLVGRITRTPTTSGA
jgi:hypothetical protein